jgi:4-alpha-glucanotransferase
VKEIHRELKRLAGLFGLQEEYTDNWGRVHRASLDAAKLILEANGVRIDGQAGLREPNILVVCEDSRPERCVFSIDSAGFGADLAPPVGPTRIKAVGREGEPYLSSLSGEEVFVHADEETGRIELSVPFPKDLPCGVYRVEFLSELRGGSVTSTAHWLVCPARAHIPRELESGGRIAGVGIALYGVRSARNWGVGDFTDLKRIIDWASDDLGVDLVGLNPLHAIFNREPFNTSPYLPSSRIFRNPIYLDVEAIPDFSESVEAREAVDSPGTQARIEELRNAQHVDYETVFDLKQRVLKEVFRGFLRRHGRPGEGDERWAEFQAYIDSMGVYLRDYAVFCALDERIGSDDPGIYSWRSWPAEFQDPASEAVERFRRENRDDVLFPMYVQWQLENQLREVREYARKKGMLVGLQHDEAVGVDRNGADFWSLREYFHEEFRVGAPPDPFAPDGQDWGFPPPNRDKMRAAAYEPFRRRLRANCRFGGALRIDHVMQIHRLFWIPEGKPPAEGVYVRDYEEELLNVIALESRRARTIIVGEDLGTVPYDLRERLMSKGVFSYRLFYFERDGKGDQLPYYEYPENALVSVSTHDLPTLAGFWADRDIDLRRDIGRVSEDWEARSREERSAHKAKIVERLVRDGLLSEESANEALRSSAVPDALHSAVLEFLFRTPSKIVLINQEDVFCDPRGQNLPGTTSEHPNWVTKMLYSVEELRSDPDAIRWTRKFRKLLDESGRGCG